MLYLLLVVVAFCAAQPAAGSDVTKGVSASGEWTQSANGSDRLPDPYKHVEIHGDSAIRISAGTYPIANLQIGKDSDDHVRVEVDEHGVTPVTIRSRHDGLRIMKDAKSHCRLQIVLRAVPPREDVTLVSGHVPIK